MFARTSSVFTILKYLTAQTMLLVVFFLSMRNDIFQSTLVTPITKSYDLFSVVRFNVNVFIFVSSFTYIKYFSSECSSITHSTLPMRASYKTCGKTLSQS